MNATRLDEEFTSSVHIYEPHRNGLPRLRPYFKALWQRKPFATEMSRASIRADNVNTFFGQIWQVLNPLFLACVYFLLVMIIRGRGNSFDANVERFVHLCAGLFVYHIFFAGCVRQGASSVVGGGKLLLNMSFPRLLLPLAEVRTAFVKFLPTLVVFFVILLGFGRPLHWEVIIAPAFFLMLGMFAAGMAMIFATMQVYFRDIGSFLPYMVRIWLYMSPILWYPDDPINTLNDAGIPEWVLHANPLYSMVGGWSELLVQGHIPEASWWIAASSWSVVALVTGALFFMSREREFAVRL
ncbi:ABC transporter permease [Phytoactinopolyspora halotolerans]|uniref:ABC transporter permease n=1 Tax=Phytoactinopolyspora halotolerans TaxID=1981512 RepID=A0A6L9SIC3_9ACTN|nr:ABC transporter permease [Phytoactinopolyspora halotolerans]NEE04081.1 ABC transporter permease [Phytoactinopolyspora halotolerans]